MKRILLFLFTVALFSCKGPKTNGDPDIKQLDGHWELDYISGPKIAFEGLFPAAKPFIVFDVANKRISGKTGCNNFGGELKVRDTVLDLSGPLAMTEMYCPGSNEEVFTKALSAITSYRIVDTILYLSARDVMTMRLIKRSANN